MTRRLLARLAAWLDPDRVVCRCANDSHEPLPGEEGYQTREVAVSRPRRGRMGPNATDVISSRNGTIK